MTKKKMTPRPRWDDMDNFTAKVHAEKQRKLEEHPALLIRAANLEYALTKLRTDFTERINLMEKLLEETRCDRDTATEKYFELAKWVDARTKAKKNLRGRPAEK